MSTREVTRELAVSVFATLSDEKLAEFIHLFGDDNTIALLESERILEDPDATIYNSFEEFAEDVKNGFD